MHVTLVGAPSLAVHPVAVYVAPPLPNSPPHQPPCVALVATTTLPRRAPTIYVLAPCVPFLCSSLLALALSLSNTSISLATVRDAMQILPAMVVAAQGPHLNPQSPCAWLHVAPHSPHHAPSCASPPPHHQPPCSGQTQQDFHACSELGT